jgi:integrase
MDQKLTANPAKSCETKVLVQSNRDVALMPPGRHRVEGEQGLYLYVSADGQVRRWLFRFTSPATRRVTEAGLDLAANVTLPDAKRKAGDMRKKIAAGVCPIAAKRKERANAVTFREAADAWIETQKPAWKGGEDGSQMRNAKMLLHKHGATLAHLPVSEVTPDKVQAALDKLWKRAPNQARRALGMWERVFDYAKAKGMRSGDNPASWRGCHEYRFPRRKAIDRGHYAALDHQQMPSFMKALRLRQQERHGAGALALEFTILTAARSGETYGMTWDEVDFEKQLWTIPALRMKGGKKHEVPLCTRAIEILELQRQYANGSGYVFTGHKRGKLADKSMASVLFYMKVKTSVHGFRSTFRDWAGDTTHYAREHVEACLAHRVGNSVELAYRRQTALEKRRVILDHWATFCAGDAVALPTAQAAE